MKYLMVLILIGLPLQSLWPSPLKLSPQLIIDQAIKTSATLAQARSSLVAINAEQLRMDAQFTTTITASSRYTDNQFEASSSLLPTNSETYDYQLGLQKRFLAGTILSANLKHNDFQGPTFQLLPPGIPSITQTQYFTSQLSFGLRQDLWKNRFGFVNDKQLAAIKLRQQNQKLLASMEIENYLMNIFDQFYQAEALVATVDIKNLRKEREEKRLHLYQQHFDRGFLEQTDLLQLQSSVIDSRQQLLEAKLAVEKVLILLEQEVKFPLKQNYVMAGNSIIFEQGSIDDVLNDCRSQKSFTHSFAQQINGNQLSEIDQLLAANANNRSPELALEAAYSANGINDHLVGTWKETLAFDHPQLAIGVTFNYAFGGAENRSQKLELIQRKEKTLIESAKIVDQLKSSQELLCAQLLIDQEKFQLLTEKKEKEQLRVQLLDNKYQVGKTDINTLVLAEDGLAATAGQLIVLQQQTNLTAWKIRQGTGKLQPFILQALTMDDGQ